MYQCPNCGKWVSPFNHVCACTIEVSEVIAFSLRSEARRRGISEEEMVKLAWEEYVSNHRSQFVRGFIKRPWLLFRPGARTLLAKLV